MMGDNAVIANVAGYAFLLILLGGLAYSYIQQRNEAGHGVLMSTQTFVFVTMGAVAGAAIGSLLFWPNLFGIPLTSNDVMEMWMQGGEDFSFLIAPWLGKSALCSVIGAAIGYVATWVNLKSAH